MLSTGEGVGAIYVKLETIIANISFLKYIQPREFRIYSWRLMFLDAEKSCTTYLLFQKLNLWDSKNIKGILFSLAKTIATQHFPVTFFD